MNSKAILILRTSALGDVVMASPLAEGVRQKFPEARICWLAEPQVSELLLHHPALDAVLILPKTYWKNLLKAGRFWILFSEIFNFIKMLRKERFGLAVDAQGLLRTRIFAWISGASQRIGLASREPGGFLMTRLITEETSTGEMGSEYFLLLDAIGVDSTQLSQIIHLPSSDITKAEQLLAENGITDPFAVFVPFTTRPQKHWLNQQWTQLSHDVTQHLGLQLVWLGGPDDAPSAARLSSDGGGVSLAGKCSIGLSAAVISRATILIGVDTGMTHAGTALGVPTIALFGATCPYRKTRSPWTTVVYHERPCSPCRRRPTCDGRFDCMHDITSSEVLQIASRLTGR